MLHPAQGLHGLGKLGLILQMNDKAVTEDAGVQVRIEIVFIVLGHIAVTGLLPGDEGGIGHIGHSLHLPLQGPGLVLGKALVDKGQDGVLLLQVFQVIIRVVGHQGEGAHNEQAGHGDADGRKGHEAVGEHIAASFPEEISEITFHLATSYRPIASPATMPALMVMTRLSK